jgi:DNA-binding MarR family transcriptional regulator
MADAKTENVVGALALALVDTLQRDAQTQAPEPGPAAAAVALIGHAPGLSIERLRRALALSHPGAVRLVDRLVADGLVVRVPAETDRRAVALKLTELGDTTCSAILSARQGGLSAALRSLTAEEAAMFGKLAEKVLRGLIRREDHAYRTCRLCNWTVCLDCPVNDELRLIATEGARA